MARRHLLVIVSVLLITQLACQSVLGAASGGGGGSGIYNAPGNPLDVTLTLDEANTVSQVVPMEGGVVTATGDDGTRYTLTVPEGTLLADTEISLTPISAIPDLPFSGGLGGAVKLEPSGLTFSDFVTLRIEPANPIPLENQILFGFEAEGEDLHLALPVNDPATIQILLLHFSGAGVASGISADKAGVMQRSADRAEARITSQVADYLQSQRQGQDGDVSGLAEYSTEFYNSVVAPRIKAAMSPSGTCADAKKALQTYLGWERQRQLLGIAPEGDDKFSKMVEDFMPVMAKKCFDEEFDRCANKHMIAGMIPVLLEFERTGQLLGASGSKGWAEARAYGEALIQKCFQWDLEFESAGSWDEGSDFRFDSRVETKIPLRSELPIEALKIKGRGPLVNVDFTFHIKGCSVDSHRGGGEFVAESLTWEAVMRKDADGEARFFVKDFKLKYDPGQTSESMTVSCEGAPSMTTPPGPLWTALFIVTHYKEAEGGGDAPPPVDVEAAMAGVPIGSQGQAYLAKFWTVYEAEQMATKEWDGGSDLDPGVLEGGEFRLIHRPQ